MSPLLLLLAGCIRAPAPPPPPDVTIGVSQLAEADNPRIFAALRELGADGVPLVAVEIDELDATLDRLDGLVLGPGADLDPALYGEEPHDTVMLVPAERQTMELALAAKALDRDMPVLGVCLGAQTLAVAGEGSLVQDIPTEVDDPLDHRGVHAVLATNGSPLSQLFPDGAMQVTSSHHQAIDAPGRHARIAAKSPDGVNEGLYYPDHLFALGVQWHPEHDDGLTDQTVLWSALVDSARGYDLRGPRTVTYTEPGTRGVPVCTEVVSPFLGRRRDLAELRRRRSGSFGDYRAGYVKGHKHGGIDLDGPASEDVFPICPGRVVDRHLGFPHLTLVVEHHRPDGRVIYSSYKHLADDDISVEVGDLVTAETRLGRIFNEDEQANSPFASIHLHFEMRHDISDEGTASWTSMTMAELERHAFDPWAFFEAELQQKAEP